MRDRLGNTLEKVRSLQISVRLNLFLRLFVYWLFETPCDMTVLKKLHDMVTICSYDISMYFFYQKYRRRVRPPPFSLKHQNVLVIYIPFLCIAHLIRLALDRLLMFAAFSLSSSFCYYFTCFSFRGLLDVVISLFISVRINLWPG